MAFKTWQNTENNATLNIEYNPLWVETDANGIVSYRVRDFQIQKNNMYGASLTTNEGFTILIVNGYGFLLPSSIVYQIPPGVDTSSIPVPSNIPIVNNLPI